MIPTRPPTVQTCCFTAAAVVLALATSAKSFVPEFVGTAVVTANLQEGLTNYRLPIGPYQAGALQTRNVEGVMDQTAWRITLSGLTTLSLVTPLRQQLAQEGWTILFECDTDACGGFDFRYGTNVLPEPDMHVDLTDFRFLSAERTAADGPEFLSLLVSRSTESGFVQVIRVGAEAAAPMAPVDPALLPGVDGTLPLPDLGDLGHRLETGGAVALDDLVFTSGSASLAEGEYPSLSALAGYLRENPARQVALVGHTDASGALAANVALSRQRAASVRDRLVQSYGADRSRIIAEGVGYLSPRASNLTPEGRTANRRVEVMLISTQ